MAATQQATDRIVSPDSTESLNVLTKDAEEKTVDAEKMQEQPLSIKDDRIVPPDVSQDTSSVIPSRERPASLDVVGDHSTVYSSNIYAPQAHAFYYGGYDNITGEWDEYPRYMNPEGVEIPSPGIYNENSSLMFHGGYGYNPQMPYGPYSPATTPLPSARADGQLYSPQPYSFTGTFYQQPVAHSMPYMTASVPMSQADLSAPVGIDQQGVYVADTPNSSGMLLGPQPGYSPYGSIDWSKVSDMQRSMAPLSPVASPQPIGAFGSYGQNFTPLATGMASQQQRPSYGFGSSTGSYGRVYSHGAMYHQVSNFGGSFSSLGASGRGWAVLDKSRRRGRGNGSLCSCNGTLDVLNEQNRGPRALRPKNPSADKNSLDGKTPDSLLGPNHELYNRPDFVTEYADARFFIIKSYSEDNVHKSIKYGVWASTTNGNKRLDIAYRETKEKGGECPVFLFFSVNASAQFCGVAEMVGPVDFDKSVDYWQQDKWSGQFPVKWHIVKDVPNSLFRHIILENNENKPVTNSRDTQEVNLEQGLEMLSIFKKHESELSILDDFNFYEDREKAMHERKVRQQQEASRAASASPEHPNATPLSGDIISQMTKNLANVVRLEGGGSKNDPPVGIANSISAMGSIMKPGDFTTPQSG
ncbi:hypothetical protein QJS10_CPA05g02478 [Acorus calamus]|uniref:YTH domain-containing family protein n=1 Tax=Acorus calamus TaxID=4465 RepID=A0AAV9EW96_ACOCL|nr:hypothetical protein QJS10_CPA05g02478 [Acorus calamus]